MRFYADGRVVGASVAGTEVHPVPWLVWDAEHCARGTYSGNPDTRDIEIQLRRSCSDPAISGEVEYWGKVCVSSDSGLTTSLSLDSLSHINGDRGTCEMVLVDGAASAGADGSVESVEEVLAALEELVGLAGLKAQVSQLATFMRVQRGRAELGLPTQSLNLHLVLSGPPGTGKTTVARLIGRLYRALGLLSSGHVVEVNRSDLVGRFIGHTATQTDDACDRALGGVLFIDEAYSLAGGGDWDFGSEAIETLITRMENDRGNLVVVLAGYPDEMHELVASNPGLQSRVSRTLSFERYSPDDLVEIFTRLVKAQGYELLEETHRSAQSALSYAYDTQTKNFGNGRFVRTLFEQAIQNQASRLAQLDNPTIVDYQTLYPTDIPNTRP